MQRETELLRTVDLCAAAMAHYSATGQEGTPRWQHAAELMADACAEINAAVPKRGAA